MNRMNVIPVQPFISLFPSLADNDVLSIDMLRLKCATLLELCAILRPSDIAPKAVFYYQNENRSSQTNLYSVGC